MTPEQKREWIIRAVSFVLAFLLGMAFMLLFAGCADSRAPLMRGQVQDDARQDEQLQPPGDELPPPKCAQNATPAWAGEVIQAARDEAKARGRDWVEVKLLLCDGPEGVAKASGLPKRKACGILRAAADKATGTVWLSRPSREDLAHELGHLFMGYGKTEEDEALADAFADSVLARLAAMERALCESLNGNDRK